MMEIVIPGYSRRYYP